MASILTITSVLAGAITILGFAVYGLEAKNGASLPSWTSWFVWWIGGLALLATYGTTLFQHTTFEARWNVLMALADAVGYSTILVFAIYKRKRGVALREFWQLSKWERRSLISAIICLGVWWFYSVELALVIALFADAVGIKPTIDSIRANAPESPRAWLLFTLAAIVSLAGLLLDSHFNGNFLTLAVISHPAYQIVGNGLIARMAWKSSRV